jgi:tetratricopeptide (TPR) repeat protein
MAVMFNATGQADSAIVYFRLAVNSAGTDPKAAEARDQSQYNLSALLSNERRWPEAVAAWQQYLAWKPDDVDGKKAYARALRASGQRRAAESSGR